MEVYAEGPCLPDIPLPDYVRSWGPEVRRADATELPEAYDHRIPTSDIFILSERTESGELSLLYVVAKSCDQCKACSQSCPRGRPCAPCASLSLACSVTEAGWDILPGAQTSSENINTTSVSKRRSSVAPGTRRVVSAPVRSSGQARSDGRTELLSSASAGGDLRKTSSRTARAKGTAKPGRPPKKMAILQSTSTPAQAVKRSATRSTSLKIRKKASTKGRSYHALPLYQFAEQADRCSQSR